MKKYLSAILFMLSVVSAKSQNNKAAPDTAIYISPQIQATYPGGFNEFMRYLSKNVKYPQSALMARLQGKVLLTFVVEKDGRLASFKVLRGISPDMNAEAIRVVKASAKWEPAKQNGIIVRQQYTVPLQFKLSKG